jgi:hypothetical protein
MSLADEDEILRCAQDDTSWTSGILHAASHEDEILRCAQDDTGDALRF